MSVDNNSTYQQCCIYAVTVVQFNADSECTWQYLSTCTVVLYVMISTQILVQCYYWQATPQSQQHLFFWFVYTYTKPGDITDYATLYLAGWGHEEAGKSAVNISNTWISKWKRKHDHIQALQHTIHNKNITMSTQQWISTHILTPTPAGISLVQWNSHLGMARQGKARHTLTHAHG